LRYTLCAAGGGSPGRTQAISETRNVPKASLGRWSGVGGPLLTAATAGALEFLHRYAFEIPNAPSIVLLVVVFATFSGGLRPGLASAGIAWIYFALAFSERGQPFDYPADQLRNLIVLAIVTPAIVAMVAVLHRRSSERVTLKLRESEERFKAFMDNSPTVAWMKDEAGSYVYVNTPFELSFNMRLADVVGRSNVQPWSAQTADQIREDERAVIASGRPRQLYEVLPGRDGLPQHWWILQFLVDDGSGQKFVGGMAVDITEQKRAEEALRASEERYALAALSVNDGLWDWNLKTNEVYYSARWKDMVGCDEREIGTDPDEWFRRIHPEDAQAVSSALTDHLEGRTPVFESEHRIRHKDRGYRWVLSRGIAVRNGDSLPYRMVGAQSDTTQRKLAEEQLIHDALHDALTGLPNRSLFLDRLAHRLRHSRREKDRLFAVLFLDLDRFKVVNDSLGHAAGDELLVEVSRRLERAVRPGDTVSRLGGDEFAILLEDVNDAGSAAHVAERIQTSIQEPIKLAGQEIVTGCSIGIALSATGYEKPEDVLRDADTAMYRAKSQGRARHEVFDSAMHARAVALLKLETDLRQAIEREEFVAHYMPIVSLESGRITGFEALVRWNHPERGVVSPLEFIGVAEDAGLVIPIDRTVLRQACRQLKEWHERHSEAGRLTVSVNLSGKQFRQPDLVECVEKAIRETGIDSACLCVEITENVLIESTEQASQMLGDLRKLGVQIYLDDFGTGYSSLSYLQRFPIDAVKIDRSFVKRMGPKKEGHEIVRAIVTLTHNLGMRVIAEGVETSDQLGELRMLRCGYGQGMLFSKPVPAGEAAALVAGDPRW
jgi:diguanylate cyclase (GGDEF)-like protein/PAS domain S-box-containing protein